MSILMQNRFRRGFFLFDALLSIIPLLLLLVFLMTLYSFFIHENSNRISRQVLFDKLVSIGDHSVKIWLAKTEGSIRYPNWIVKSPDPEHLRFLQESADLSNLYVSLEPPGDGDYSMCISRIVVVGEEKSFGQLFVCGG